MNLKYFGTDGIRGRYGESFIQPAFAWRMGKALAFFLASRKPSLPINVVIGRDPRASGGTLSDAIASGLTASRVFVHNVGVVPTPAVAHSVLALSADLGVMVTASHNPAQDNGIKLFDARGFKFSRQDEQSIEALIDAEPDPLDPMPLPKYYPFEGLAHYINTQCALLDERSLQGMEIVVDAANGSMAHTAPLVFERMGVRVRSIGDKPDGTNINASVGSEFPAEMAHLVQKYQAQMGFAFDGDGDRLVVCDELGHVIDGDELLGIFACYALKSDALKKDVFVSTIQSNLGLDHAINACGGRVERVQVGDRHVAHRMHELGANLGGENSGHIIFSEFSTTGDGLLAACKLVDLVKKTGQPLSQLRSNVSLFPQSSISLKVSEKKPLPLLKHVTLVMERLEQKFAKKGRILVRYSGTESKLRLLLEHQQVDALEPAMHELIAAAKSDLDVL